jgi:hypothetical protein
MAGLEPNTICIWHPAPFIFDVDVGNEMVAAPAARIEAISETVEGGDWHLSLPCLPPALFVVSAGFALKIGATSRSISHRAAVWHCANDMAIVEFAAVKAADGQPVLGAGPHACVI